MQSTTRDQKHLPLPEALQTGKKPYRAPQLKAYGAVSEKTLSTGSGGADDGLGAFYAS